MPERPAMNPKYKGGKLDLKEKTFIKLNSGTMTIEAMSKKLNRTPSIIETFLEELGAGGVQVSETLDALRKGHEYALLKEEFNEKELKIFEKKYSEWVGQFQDDITSSEKNQIFNAIKYEILMSKTLQRNKKTEEEIASLEKEIEYLKSDAEMDNDKREKRIKDIRDYKRDIWTNLSANIGVYERHSKMYMEMLKNLKASRDQRVTKTDTKKSTFMSLLASMREDSQRNRIGEEAELERLAAEAEGEKFKQTTEFLDGSLAEPFITGQDQ